MARKSERNNKQVLAYGRLFPILTSTSQQMPGRRHLAFFGSHIVSDIPVFFFSLQVIDSLLLVVEGDGKMAGGSSNKKKLCGVERMGTLGWVGSYRH